MSMKLIATLQGSEGRIVKVYRDSGYGEYVARLYIGGKLYAPADCYDSDKDSMLGTAASMARG